MWHKKGATDPRKYPSTKDSIVERWVLASPSAKVKEEIKGQLKGMERMKRDARKEWRLRRCEIFPKDETMEWEAVTKDERAVLFYSANPRNKWEL
jgi:hypothetical protein